MTTTVPVAPAATGGEGEEWDTIVIGSGMGGLSVASLIAQGGCDEDENRRVLILEQHPYHAGGCCQAFERGGYRFGVGVHFVGGMDEGEEEKKMMDALTLEDDPIEWTPMKDFETTLIGKGKLKTYALDSTRQSLIERFPDEKESIEKFGAMSRKAAACWFRALVFKSLPRWIASFLVNTGLDRLLNKDYRKYAKMTVGEAFRSLPITDPDLKIILGGGCIAYGMTPEEAPFIMHSLLFAQDDFKAFYPSGGPGMIPKKIIRAIEANGGEVRVNSKVARILVEGGRAVGVELADGQTIRAKHQVISDAGFFKTFHQFVPKALQPSRRMLAASADESLKNGMTGVILYVGLKGEYDDDYRLPCNLSVEAPDRARSLPETMEGLAGMEADGLSLYITCPSGKDGSWKKTCTGKTTLEILLANVPWKAFEGLIDEDGKLKEEKKEMYDQFKHGLGQLIWTRTRQALLEVGASEELPTLLEDADFSEVGTPLTFRHFLGSDRGAWYGLEHSRDRFHPRNYYILLRPECDIAGLYLTGEDVVTDGVAGALLGGYLCAAKILGARTPTDIIEKVHANRANKKT